MGDNDPDDVAGKLSPWAGPPSISKGGSRQGSHLAIFVKPAIRNEIIRLWAEHGLFPGDCPNIRYDIRSLRNGISIVGDLFPVQVRNALRPSRPLTEYFFNNSRDIW